MDIDALVVLLPLPSRGDLGAAVAGLYRALDEVGAEIDPWPHQCVAASGKRCQRCVPQEVSSALKAARARAREKRLLDRLWPPLLHRAWQPLAPWLCGIGRVLAGARGPWGEVVGSLPGGIVARSRGGVAFMFALWAEAKAAPVVALLFDWQTFNRCTKGPLEIARVVATVGSRIGSVAGAGGPSEVWRSGVRRCVAQPARCDAMLAASRGTVQGFGEHSVDVGRFVVGWRPPREPAGRQDKGEATAALDEDATFLPRWTGCSGRFAPRNDGQDEANLHYDKHVRVQREWPTEAMPDVTAYVVSAAHALDAVEHAFEFWQPSNHAVVKYDPGHDVLAIGNLHDGDLRTCFRPGGADYVLRKLRAGQWVPTPLLGAVVYDAVHDDEELTALFAEFERAVAEADAEARAAAAHDAGRILSAIASQERAEYLGWRVRSQYLTTADEARVDAVELAFAEARAALDVALEVWQPDARAWAVAMSTDRYIQAAPDILASGDLEEMEELLGLRDRIEWARMVTRGRGRLAGMVPVSAFREVELVATDALIAVCRRGVVDPAPAGGWPETFVWRGAKAE